MKRNYPCIFSLLLFLSNSAFGQGQTTQGRIHLMPEPVQVQPQAGTFLLNNHTSFVIGPAEDSLLDPARLFNQMIRTATGFSLDMIRKSRVGKGDIQLLLNPVPDTVIGAEGYRLNVTPKNITIRANHPAGIFYGLQTLVQLLPPDIQGKLAVSTAKWPVPCVQITDFPRFGWRGMMLDVSRHFFTKKEVESYIDEMSKYKFNIFHWHLSDDQGWRIQIKGLPRLTSVGAWRVFREGVFGNGFAPPQPGEPDTYGGFYTQKDIREIVKYAQDRFITILPEIDVPAHSLALIASYPNLSCTQYSYPVNPGSPFYEVEDNVLCPGNDSTYIILDTIFSQIARLFPCPYIHIGGDEAYKGFWAKDLRDQKLMAKLHLTNVEQLQSYFVKRMATMLASMGKKLIGWDEILEGGLAPSATVMSWRGMAGGIAAARMGHHVIMTPDNFVYLDLYQGDPSVETPTYGRCLLKTCYSFEPVPDSVDPSLILGGQGNLWSEAIPNFRQAEYMTWPRAMAISEVLWSPKASRNWPDFISRMEAQFPRLDAEQVKYSLSEYQPIILPVLDSLTANLEIKLETQIPDLKIYYTFDNTNPDNFSPLYEGQPLSIPNGAKQIRVVTYRGDKPIGQQINLTVKELRSRLRGY